MNSFIYIKILLISIVVRLNSKSQCQYLLENYSKWIKYTPKLNHIYNNLGQKSVRSIKGNKIFSEKWQKIHANISENKLLFMLNEITCNRRICLRTSKFDWFSNNNEALNAVEQRFEIDWFSYKKFGQILPFFDKLFY